MHFYGKNHLQWSFIVKIAFNAFYSKIVIQTIFIVKKFPMDFYNKIISNALKNYFQCIFIVKNCL